MKNIQQRTEAQNAYEAYRALHREVESLISQCDRLSDRVAHNEREHQWNTACQLRKLWQQKKKQLIALTPRLSEARDKWVSAQLAEQKGGQQWSY